MRFLDDTVSVTFEYDFVPPAKEQRTLSLGGFVRATTCTIRAILPTAPKEVGQLVSKAVVRCSRFDSDNKFTARKMSLSRALAGAKFNKAERARIWQEYFVKTKMQ